MSPVNELEFSIENNGTAFAVSFVGEDGSAQSFLITASLLRRLYPKIPDLLLSARNARVAAGIQSDPETERGSVPVAYPLTALTTGLTTESLILDVEIGHVNRMALEIPLDQASQLLAGLSAALLKIQSLPSSSH